MNVNLRQELTRIMTRVVTLRSSSNGDAFSIAQVVQNQTQQVAVGNSKESQPSPEMKEPQGVMQSPAASCDILHKCKVAAVGFEHPSNSSMNSALFDQGGAESGAVAGIDPELRSVIEAWDQLPCAIKTGIIEMVRSASG